MVMMEIWEWKPWMKSDWIVSCPPPLDLISSSYLQLGRRLGAADRQRGGEPRLLLLQSLRQRVQLLLQQHLLQAAPLLDVQEALRLPPQQLVALLLDLRGKPGGVSWRRAKEEEEEGGDASPSGRPAAAARVPPSAL